MTTEEVAQTLKVHLNTVRLWARDGLRPARRVGRHWRFATTAVLPDVLIDDTGVPEKLNAHQAAAFLRVPVTTIYSSARAGRLPVHRGHRYNAWLFDRDELMAWLTDEHADSEG